MPQCIKTSRKEWDGLNPISPQAPQFGFALSLANIHYQKVYYHLIYQLRFQYPNFSQILAYRVAANHHSATTAIPLQLFQLRVESIP